MKIALNQIFAEVKSAFMPERRRFSQHWEKVPTIAAAQLARETEDNRYRNLCDYALHRWGSRLRQAPLSALVLNVSRAPELPEILLQTERVAHVLAVDSDAVALENLLDQKKSAVETWQMDLDRDPLPRGPFDIIVARDALNYARNPDFVGGQIERVLDRSGLFIAREYVGPNRLQFTETQMQMVNALLTLIPEHLRRALNIDEPLEKQFAPELAEMLRLDPAKAACSEDLEKMIYLRFRVMKEIPLGGTLLAPLLAGIGGNFTDRDREAERILTSLLAVEMQMISGGLLRSDYKAFICRLP